MPTAAGLGVAVLMTSCPPWLDPAAGAVPGPVRGSPREAGTARTGEKAADPAVTPRARALSAVGGVEG